MARLHISHTDLPAKDSERLLGSHIDTPRAGESRHTFDLPLAGWVLGRDEQPESVDVVSQGNILWTFRPDKSRPDLTDAFSNVPWAGSSGFRTSVSTLRLPLKFEFVLRAVFADGHRAPFALLRGEHEPLQTDFLPQFQPIMMTNIGRSGSTWLTHLLAQHPNVVVYRPFDQEPRVLNYWMEVLRSLSEPLSYLQAVAPDIYDSDWWIGLRRQSPLLVMDFDPELERWVGTENLEATATFCQERVDAFYGKIAAQSASPAATHFVERIYGSGKFVPEIVSQLYRGAREIFLVRDFRDVLCSINSFNAKTGLLLFGRDASESDVDYTVKKMAPNARGLMHQWRMRRDGSYLLRYEDLIRAPEATLSQLFAYLGLDAGEGVAQGVLSRAENAAQSQQLKHTTAPSRLGSIGRWRTDLPDELKKVCKDSLAEPLAEFGYA